MDPWPIKQDCALHRTDSVPPLIASDKHKTIQAHRLTGNVLPPWKNAQISNNCCYTPSLLLSLGRSDFHVPPPRTTNHASISVLPTPQHSHHKPGFSNLCLCNVSPRYSFRVVYYHGYIGIHVKIS